MLYNIVEEKRNETLIGLYLTLIDSESDKQRFVLLYEKYQKLMFYVAKKILDDDYMAEDAVQEAFLRIAKNFSKINQIDCPQTRKFVVIITRNTSINLTKQRFDFDDLNQFDDVELSKEDDSLFSYIEHSVIKQCILNLPEQYRDVLYLYHLYGFSFKEISSLLGITTETAKKRAQRARSILRVNLEKEGCCRG